jgi:hypothetical protein
MLWSLLTEDDVVKLDTGETSVIGFENLCLIPGQKYVYTTYLESDRLGESVIHLDFAEVQERTLKNFAYAKVEIDGEEVCDELLAKLFEGEALSANVDFSDTNLVELKIVYYLPIEVGNEAQEAEAIFQLNLTIE